jgi:hypothetical protein
VASEEAWSNAGHSRVDAVWAGIDTHRPATQSELMAQALGVATSTADVARRFWNRLGGVP